MIIGYPGNNEYPRPYYPVTVIVRSKKPQHLKSAGMAYWSGFKWIGIGQFRIGYGKVIKWIDE